VKASERQGGGLDGGREMVWKCRRQGVVRQGIWLNMGAQAGPGQTDANDGRGTKKSGSIEDRPLDGAAWAGLLSSSSSSANKIGGEGLGG
jgi:hypothetical protein